ncbi:MAG: putative RDD family membrane protein YckC, partial [Bacteroidia bacterium]
MNNVDYWTAKYQDKTKEALEQILLNQDKYQADAIMAARILLEERGEDATAFDSDNIEPNRDSSDADIYEGRIASRGLRFVHYIIDYFVIQVITITSESVVNCSELVLGYIYRFDTTSLILPIDPFNWILVFFLYYFILEWRFQITFGKLVSKTIVVNRWGETISITESFLRTLSRLIPLNAFSCLVKPSRGWHDKLSKTYVIYKKELEAFKNSAEKKDVTTHLIA